MKKIALCIIFVLFSAASVSAQKDTGNEVFERTGNILIAKVYETCSASRINCLIQMAEYVSKQSYTSAEATQLSKNLTNYFVETAYGCFDEKIDKNRCLERFNSSPKKFEFSQQ